MQEGIGERRGEGGDIEIELTAVADRDEGRVDQQDQELVLG